MTPILATVFVTLSLAYSFRMLVRCRELSRAAQVEEDELEQRLAEKALKLELELGRRVVRALARATLFGGTGLAVWELTGGSSHYPQAGVAFILGFVGWAGAIEIERRIGGVSKSRLERHIGSLAGARGARKPTR